VIMLNKQGAHGLSLIWILTIGSLQPVVRRRRSDAIVRIQTMLIPKQRGADE
jgi:hypothetical protein